MIIFHHGDPDGWCAAAIVNMWVSQNMKSLKPDRVEFREMQYKDNPDFSDIGNELVVIVDFSFKPDVFRKLQERTKNIIWCDHHTSCKDYDYAKEDIPGIRDFNNPCLAGCELAWKHFIGTDIPWGVELLGDYDAFRLEHDPECFQFFEGLKTLDNNPKSDIWYRIFKDMEYVEHIIEIGKTIIKYRDLYVNDMYKNYSYETEIDGHKAIALNLYRFGSAAFGEHFKKYPICIAYIHDGHQYTVSLYSDNKVDVSKVAQKYGGGGHEGAAGFVCDSDDLPFYRKY